MKIQGGNIDKAEDKIIRVDQTESEETSNPIQSVLGVTDLLPGLSILQLSDVGPKKTFKGNRGKALIVSDNEQYMTFGDAGGGNVEPIVLEYASELLVDLSEGLNYILTLTGDCTLTLINIQPGCVYQFLIIQDNVGGHTLNIAHPCYYQDGYTQDTTANSHSKLIVDKVNDEYYVSISKYEQRIANITWEDYDGTTLATSTVAYGDTPVYSGPTPTRAGYTFVGWTPTPGAVFGDITYVATYEQGIVGLPGIFWNQNDGLISISSDGSTWLTMQDKNVGATQVFEFADQIFTSATCGDYYSNYGIYSITLPTGYHLPTSLEWATIIAMGRTLGAWGEKGGLYFSTYLKLPCAGIKTGGQSMWVGQTGRYYLDNNNTPNALTFDTFSDTTTIQISTTTGTALQPTRLMADTPVVPDATRTRLY